jgi:protein O-GlcNAc transferase
MTEAKADPGQRLHEQANALQDSGRHEEAIALYDQAIALTPNIADLHYDKGLSLVALGRVEEALAAFEAARSYDPAWVEAHFNCGNMLQRQGRFRDALAAFNAALEREPRMAAAWRNRGGVLEEMGRFEEALASVERARALKPEDSEIEFNRGGLLIALQRFDEAQAALELTLKLDPGNANALGLLAAATTRTCDLSRLAEVRSQVLYDVAARKTVLAPITLLTISDDPALQRLGAEQNVKAMLGRAATSEIAPRPPAYAHDRLRIAYMSFDFAGDHPVGAHVAGLLERHDRAKFEVLGVALATPDESAVGKRIAKACDRLHVVQDKSDEEAAAFVRSLEADILVDLNGPTRGWRPAILNRRPAVVQAAYLGYAGTTGAASIDYLIADTIVAPPGAEVHFTEQLVRLPHCFWPADPAAPAAALLQSRTALGLPESGFVFCAFNAHRKINAETFGAWMRLLADVPGSVLWLRQPPNVAMRALQREAARRGIGAERLIWAPHTDTYAAHLARHAHADLFLDTFPYGAHATAAAALGAGLPVLTRRGESFVSRVAASFLHTLEIDELIADNLPDYEAKALALANNPARLAALHAGLAASHAANPFFDGPRFARDIEAAYAEMHAIARAGQAPRPIMVRA